jgi:hypothetical protein
MNTDPNEVARFKESLRKSSLESIRRGLDDFVIVRSWKRKLAEGEPERRQKDLADQQHDVSARNKGLRWRVWSVLLIMIFLVLAMIVMAEMGYWR